MCCMQYAAKNDTEDAMSVGDKRNGIDPDWVTADRVIARQSTKGDNSLRPQALCDLAELMSHHIKWFNAAADRLAWS